MKRILVLLLAVCMVLSLSATAWAADLSVSFSPSNTTVKSGTVVTITGSYPPDTIGTEPDRTDIEYELAITGGNGTFKNTNRANFQIEMTVTESNKSITLTLTKKTTIYVGDIVGNILPTTQSWDQAFTIATEPTMSASNITVTCGGSPLSVSASGGDRFQAYLPASSIYNGDNVNISLTKGNFVIGGGQTTTGNANILPGTTYGIKVSSEGYDDKIYYLDLKSNTGNSANIGSLSVSGSTGSISSHSTNSSSPTGIGVGSDTTSVNISASASAGSTADVKIYSGYTGNSQITSSLTINSATTDFRVEVISPNGANKNTYFYRINRAANTTIVSDITLRTGTGTSTAQMGSATGAISTTNYNTTRTIQIPASHRGTTIFYLHVTLPSGSTMSSNPISVSIPSATTSKSQNVTVTANGTSYTIPINITRQTTSNTLKSVSFTYNSSKVGELTNLSAGATQTLNLNTTATSATLKWELADGATLSSVKWGNTSVSNSVGTSGYSAGLPGSGSTALVFVIQASNGTSYTTTINVSKNATAVNTLESLYIKRSATNSTNDNYLFETKPSSFSRNTTNYTVYVDSDVDAVYVYPTPTNSNATVTVSGTYSGTPDNRYSSNGYFKVNLRSGSNTVNVNVSVNNNTATTYKLTIEREEEVEQNASLNSLYASKSSTSTSTGNRYTLDPGFAYNKTTYDVDVAKNVTEVFLHFTTYKSNATVSVNGATKVSDGVYKATLTANKTKTVTITVGYSNDDTKYTINLNNGNASSRAQLTRIRVASQESSNSSYQYDLLPDFDASVTDYVAMIPYKNSASYAYVQATLDDNGNELLIDGDKAESGDWVEISVNRGKSVSVPIKVTDDDDNITTYNLKIVAAKNNANDDADLDTLSVRTGSSTSSELTLSPTFSRNTTSYTTANVPNSTSSVRVYAEPSDNEAWVIVNNVLTNGSYAEVDLDEGKNEIKVLVYAADCDTHKTYTVTVNRGPAGGSDSTLSNLEARYGSSGQQTLNLIPAFAKATTSYRINVDGSMTQIAFRPTATDSTATISIMGKDEVSGQWTSYNALNNGGNNFLIIVTSGDGSNKSYYTVTVERGLSVVVSNQKMKVNGVDVTTAAYNINGNNYFKLRDIAYALRGTPKHFDVGYNSVTRVVSMTSGRDYTIIGGEMIRPVAPGKYQLSNQTVTLDGKNINLIAYNVDGNNYFMLREIGQLFNCGVDYDASTSTVIVDSSKVYTPE